MAKFRKKKGNDSQNINTSSLPDIVFMLLFFFMVATKMRDNEMKVKTTMPQAVEVEKLVKKSLVSYIYVGPPMDPKTYGETPRIQLNDAFATVGDIPEYITLERAKLAKQNEKLVQLMTTAIKADVSVKMGIVSDIKQELRDINALKVSYLASRKAGE